MIKIVKTQKRLNTDIPFYEDAYDSPAHYKEHVYKNYIRNGKMISTARSLSEDKLTQTIIMTWDTVDSFLDFCTDDFCINEYISIVSQYEICNQFEIDISIDNSN